MGRHSSDERGPYIRSIVAWATPWVVVAVVVGVAVWVAVDAVGGDDVALRRPPNASPEPRPTRSPTPDATPTPVEAATPEPTPTPAPKQEREKQDRKKHEREKQDRKKHVRKNGGLITRGVTVQVINGTGGVEGAAAATADRLAQLGYRVVAITTGLTADRSVVYWSSESARDAALALAEHLGWIAEPAPTNLSSEIDLSVVVSASDATL